MKVGDTVVVKRVLPLEDEVLTEEAKNWLLGASGKIVLISDEAVPFPIVVRLGEDEDSDTVWSEEELKVIDDA